MPRTSQPRRSAASPISSSLPAWAADAGGPYTLKEGSALTLDASHSSDASGYPLTYSWTLNGAANAGSGFNPTLTYAQIPAFGFGLGGVYDISLQVDEGHGASASATTTLSIVVGDPAKLAFEPGTNDATAGQTIPAFNVDVQDQLGTLVTTDTSSDGHYYAERDVVRRLERRRRRRRRCHLQRPCHPAGRHVYADGQRRQLDSGRLGNLHHPA